MYTLASYKQDGDTWANRKVAIYKVDEKTLLIKGKPISIHDNEAQAQSALTKLLQAR